MKTLIQYLRSCFCRHEWELLLDRDLTTYSLMKEGDVVIGHKWVYFCKKCGHHKAIRE